MQSKGGIFQEQFAPINSLPEIFNEEPALRDKESAERSLFRENPTISPERLSFLKTTAEIHRRFIKDIMGEGYCGLPKAELVVFTGATCDLAAEPLSVAAYIEGYKPEDLPDIASWESLLYFDRHAAAPNSLVYKHVSEKSIRVALENVRTALSLEGNKVSVEGHLLQILSLSPKRIYAKIAEIVDSIKVENLPFDKLLLARVVERGIEGGLIDLSDLDSDKRFMLQNVRSEVETATQLRRLFPGDLENLRLHLVSEITRIESGEYEEVRKDVKPGIDDRMDTYYVVPLGEPRVILMKALYPEFLGALFNENGTPKEVAFYDNVSVSGVKVNAYLDFFEALGTSDKTRIYLMYTKPGASAGFKYTPTRVIVGREITENYVRDYVDRVEDAQFMGRTHDRKTALETPQFSHSGEMNEAKMQRRKLLAYYEQLGLPECMISVEQRALRLKNVDVSKGDELTLEFLSKPPLPRIITPSYKDYPPEEYPLFEKTYDRNAPTDREKRYMQDLKLFLDKLNEKVELLSEGEHLRVIVLDLDLIFFLQSFLRLPQYHHLRERVILNNLYDISKQAEEKKYPTIALGNTYPRIFSESNNKYIDLETAGISIQETWLLADNRREYTDEKRHAALDNFIGKLSITVNNLGQKWQELQAQASDDVGKTIAERFDKKEGNVRIPQLSEISGLLLGGADLLVHNLNALHEQRDKLTNDDSRLKELKQTDEYSTYEEHVSNLVQWGVQLWNIVLSELEQISKIKGEEDFHVWENVILRLQNLKEELAIIKQLQKLFYDFDLSMSFKEMYPDKKTITPSTNYFDLFNDLCNGLYDGPEKYIEELSEHLHNKYSEKYYMGSGVNQVIALNSTQSDQYFVPRVYGSSNDPLVKAIEISRRVEMIRYLTEIVAGLPLIDVSFSS